MKNAQNCRLTKRRFARCPRSTSLIENEQLVSVKTHPFKPPRLYLTLLLLAASVSRPFHLQAQLPPVSNTFEAKGSVVFTRFDTSQRITFKSVKLFHVLVDGAQWRIRTEPVFETLGGIAYDEASGGTNNTIFKLTALKTAPSKEDSTLDHLRMMLKLELVNDEFFANRPHVAAVAYSNYLSSVPQPSSRNPASNRSDNVAIALALKGNHLPADPSYINFLWFAFTPQVEIDGMLLQTWDDASSPTVRYRHAQTTQLEQFPYLIAAGEFKWTGRQVEPTGQWKNINISDIRNPFATAARYTVNATTNFGHMTLPLSFELTRFRATTLNETSSSILSTLVAKVTELSRPVDQLLSIKMPGKTFVTDHRTTTEIAKPAAYFASPNLGTTLNDVEMRPLHAPRHISRLSWPFLVLLLSPSLLLGGWWMLSQRYKRQYKDGTQNS